MIMFSSCLSLHIIACIPRIVPGFFILQQGATALKAKEQWLFLYVWQIGTYNQLKEGGH